MATCDAQTLQTQADSLQGIPQGSLLAILVALRCAKAGVSCDPNTLLNQSVCQISCLPIGTLLAILVYQECQNGGGGGSSGVQQLIAGAGISLNPAGGTGIVTITVTGSSGFTSGLFTLNAATWTAAHGISSIPKKVRAVLICTVNDASSGLVVGQEMDVTSFFDPGDGVSAFSVTADATNITVGASVPIVGAEAGIFLDAPGGSGFVNVTSFNNFRLKIYASL